MTVYMEVTQDKYELPVAIADNAEILAKKCGTTKNSIFSIIAHAKKDGRKARFVKVEIDED